MNWQLKRRGYKLGAFNSTTVAATDLATELQNWPAGKPCLLRQACLDTQGIYTANIEQSEHLYAAILGHSPAEQLIDQAPYAQRLNTKFESLGSSINEGDEQEIETVLFDALENAQVVAPDLWMKISWLSFYEQDASLRFRFSFGMDHVEDVASDKQRQRYAAQLTDLIFPESRLITHNKTLHKSLENLLESTEVQFVERIVYFNSPNGGAYLHHDRERGHAGVVYAQLSGQTYWLALPRRILIKEIVGFVDQCQARQKWPASLAKNARIELTKLSQNKQLLISQLESFANDTLIHLINETQEFVQHLITAGHGRLMQTGDILLLPQASEEDCCWHSVFCLGEQAGQALSFAIRAA